MSDIRNHGRASPRRGAPSASSLSSFSWPLYALNPRNRDAVRSRPPAFRLRRTDRCPLRRLDRRHRHRHHGTRVGRHPGVEHAAAALVAVAVLRLHRLGHRLPVRLSGDPARLQLHQGVARLRHVGTHRRQTWQRSRRSAAQSWARSKPPRWRISRRTRKMLTVARAHRKGGLRHQLRSLPWPGRAGRGERTRT